MNIGILSRSSQIYSTRRMLHVARERGHNVQIVNPLRCYMNVSKRHPEIHFQGRVLENFDAIIPRIGTSITFYGTAVVRQFEMMGVFTLNSSRSINRSRNKLVSMQLLAQHGLPMPRTGFADSPGDTDDLLDLVGGTPVVIKLTEGTQGMGVVLGETKKAAESVIEALRGLQATFLVQEYIEEANGEDIRCLVIGNEVVAAMKRHAKEGDFRSNLHRGGYAIVEKISAEERKIAVQASQILGLDVAGVDLLRSRKGPLVLEVNSSPGLEGIEKSSGVDIASKMIDYLEKNTRHKNQ
ncbi:MAG: 30S ribosomal protein S6--L-glutamate ligase [Gammaproteobacteria bacterium]|nr:30S ribosomal protein S6--L-glutamate ligase [Gammaproteobacteria bacterium]NNM14057.1 30S ribosomal protein S6--L-glutamate ligase [Gammaproteobacteria bacterium]